MKTILYLMSFAIVIGLIGCRPPRFFSLRRTIESGTMDAVRRDFSTRNDVTSPIQDGSLPELYSYPLHLAVSSGRVPVVKYFLRLGADPNSTDHLGYTAFFELNGEEETMSSILQLLVKAGGDINKPEPEFQETPLMYAASFGRGTIIRLLVQNGADLRCKSSSDRTAFDCLSDTNLYSEKELAELREILRVPNSK